MTFTSTSKSPEMLGMTLSDGRAIWFNSSQINTIEEIGEGRFEVTLLSGRIFQVDARETK